MSINKWIYSAFMIVVLFLFSFSTAEKAYTHPAGMPKSQDTVVVTDTHSGKRISIARGNVLVVRLESQPGTGYGWQVVRSDSTRLKSLGEPW